MNLARDQHRQYVSILRECGVKVVELASLEVFPDSVFMQDPALITIRAIVGRFGETKRRGEEKAFADELSKYKAEVGEMSYVSPPATLGGLTSWLQLMDTLLRNLAELIQPVLDN